MNQKEENNVGLVSIIIPTYNREKYVLEAVESVLKQDYNKIEVIVVDDHSTDNTVNLLQEHYHDEPRVKCVISNSESRGANHARNFGINIAKGEYCAFLDSDDILTEKSISYRVNSLIKHPEADMAYGDVYVGDNLVHYDDINNYDQNKYLMQELSLCCYIVILARMDAMKKVLPLDLSLTAWQDDALVLALNKAGCKFIHCGKPCARIRRIDESITTKHHNMYYSLPLLVAKYKEDIIEGASHFRYLLWKLRIALDYLYTKKEKTESTMGRICYSVLIRFITYICRLYFRHIYG